MFKIVVGIWGFVIVGTGVGNGEVGTVETVAAETAAVVGAFGTVGCCEAADMPAVVLVPE